MASIDIKNKLEKLRHCYYIFFIYFYYLEANYFTIL